MACSRTGWDGDEEDFVDDDEELRPEFVELLMERLADPYAAGPSLSFEEAFGDGGCPRRIEGRRPVRYGAAPRGRGRLPSGCP